MNRYNDLIAAMSDKLDSFHVPHSVNDCWDGAQIRFPWCEGDVAFHSGTHFHQENYVETYRFPWDKDDVSVFTPNEAIEKIVALYIEKLAAVLDAGIHAASNWLKITK